MASSHENSPDRRTQKRLATRQRISDAATGLFMERGFDAVTVDQIAHASGVSRMTVFNHFARKEDMLFDLDELGRQDVLAALECRDLGIAPIEALRLFAHRAVAERRPYVLFCEAGTDRFVQTVQASEALMARARAIRDEFSDLVAAALAKATGRKRPDPDASLAASLLVAAWAVAFVEAHRTFNTGQDAARAYTTFLALIDQGSNGAKAAVPGTRYV
ncbi:TetR/AcrR family transcriptional regulator [Acidipila sp. EB88]|uniref:TetR/AcrR family transcriptional regulator n=1 Tax=Acidipila sp. EB88 TaxID=2305226 RepID=UPI000F5FC1A9|nr:TetR/AcrR family transcriptional regulator [Acidipila sp. EB88]RRA49548.1 TetR/AcrR family transcriptional regulator [Acidipila sp. EB88]